MERGKEYYKQGLVKSLVRDKNVVTARVVGNSLYRVEINLKNGEMNCTCPCDFNCKHMAAVLYALRANKADDAENLFAPLKNKKREELEEIIQRIVLENPELAIFVNSNDSDLKKEIKELWLTGDKSGFEIKADRLFNIVLKKENPLELELLLFRKLFDIYEHFGGTESSMEQTMFKLLNQIYKELKKPKNAKVKKKTLKELSALVKDYDWFLDAIGGS